MKATGTRLAVATLAGLTLCAILFARMTSAQSPGAPLPGGQASANQQPNFPGAGQRRFGGQAPMISGTITAGDANSGRITIQAPYGPNSRTVQITNTTRIVGQVDVNVGDLQVNDPVQVQGVPTGITASSITAGQAPDFLQPGRLRSPIANGGGPAGSANAEPANVNAMTAFASATGRVTSVHPLTISVGNDVSITIRSGANTHVTRIMPLNFNNLKVGDRVIAVGQSDNAGVYMATSLAVNISPSSGMVPGSVNPNGFGPRGFGGPGVRAFPGGSPGGPFARPLGGPPVGPSGDTGSPAGGGPAGPGGPNGSGN